MSWKNIKPFIDLICLAVLGICGIVQVCEPEEVTQLRGIGFLLVALIIKDWATEDKS